MPTIEIDEDDVKKSDPEKLKLDMADGVPHLRGMNRKESLERRYRDQGKDEKFQEAIKGKTEKNKKPQKTGMNETAVDCLHFGLMCCECTIS